MLVVGVSVSVIASLQILRTQVHVQNPRFLTTVSFFGLCLAFFGGSGIISLAVVDGLDRGAVASNVAVGAGLVAWSVTGLRSPRLDARVGDTTLLGLVILAVALIVAFITLTPVLGSTAALVALVAAWFMAGLGMGLSYPRISSEATNDFGPERVSGVATAVAFAETAGTAVGALLGGGTYSLASAHAVPAATSIGWAFLLLGATAVATIAASLARRRAGHRRRRRRGRR